MPIRRWLGTLLLMLSGAGGLAGQDAAGEFQTRVWLDRGEEPLLQRGDRVRVYYRASADAYVAVFQIDTDGSVRLLHPRSPDDEHFVRAGRDYRLLFPQSSYWYVDEYPGKGYFFILASPEPFDFGAFGYATYERGWDLTAVGRAVYEDPYVAIDEYVARLIPDWETVPYALDFIEYDVGEHHEYPRFLCYDCHGFQAYPAWNPYTYACSSFRVVIWDDPYFYPAYRYRGTRVVFAQPPRGIARFEFKERAAGEAWSPLVRTRQPPLRRSVEYAEPAVAAPPMQEFAPPRRRVVPSDALREPPTRTERVPSEPPAGTRSAVPRGGASAEPGRDPGDAPPRRPSTGLPGNRSVAPPTSQPRQEDRPVLQRRPPPPVRRGGDSGVRSSGGSPTGAVRSDPSSGRSRVTLPSRPSGSSARPGGSRPAVRSSPPAASRPTARPSSPPARSRPAAKPRGGNGASKPPPRRPGGSGGL